MTEAAVCSTRAALLGVRMQTLEFENRIFMLRSIT